MNRRWRAAATGFALMAMVACDIPTSPPQWDQTWVVPAEDMSLSVAELLPAGVAISSDSSAFVVNINGMSDSFTLGQFCPPCVFLNGLTVVKPAFDTTLSTTQTLPADIVSATASAGQFSLTVENNFSFDPLRPSPSNPANTGFMTIAVRSAGRLVAYDSIDGADPDGAFPPNTPRDIVVDIIPGPLADSLSIDFRLNSPAGDPTTIDTSEGLFVTLHPGTFEVTQAEVAVADMTVNGTPSTFDFSGLPDYVVNRVQSGVLLFTIENPFDVNGAFTLTLAPPNGSPVVKTFDIPPGSSTPSVDFNATELQALLSQPNVQITTTGVVNATGGTVTVTPDQVMTLKADLGIKNRVGGEANQ